MSALVVNLQHGRIDDQDLEEAVALAKDIVANNADDLIDMEEQSEIAVLSRFIDQPSLTGKSAWLALEGEVGKIYLRCAPRRGPGDLPGETPKTVTVANVDIEPKHRGNGYFKGFMLRLATACQGRVNVICIENVHHPHLMAWVRRCPYWQPDRETQSRTFYADTELLKKWLEEDAAGNGAGERQAERKKKPVRKVSVRARAAGGLGDKG